MGWRVNNCRGGNMRRTMTLNIIMMFMAFVFIPSTVVWAVEKRPLDLEQCIKIGLENNLQLQNEKMRRDMAETEIVAAGKVYDTLLSVGGTHSDSKIPDAGSFYSGAGTEVTDASAELSRALPGGTRLSLEMRQTKLTMNNPVFEIPPYSASASFSISQSLMRNAFGATDRALMRRAEHGSDIAENVYKREEELLALRIVEVYWDLYAARRGYEAVSESIGLAQRLLEVNRRREKDGLLDATDVLAAEAALAVRSADLLELSNRVDNASDMLTHVIQLPREEVDNVTFIYPTESQLSETGSDELARGVDLNKTAFENRTDFIALQARVIQAEINLDIQKDALRPDLKLIGTIARGQSDISFRDSLAVEESEWVVGARFETSFGKSMERSNCRKAELALKEAENNLNDIKDAISRECSSAQRSLVNADSRVEAVRRAMILLEKRLSEEEKKFEQGRSDSRWIIQAQDELTLARMSYHTALAEYKKASERYHVALGLEPGGRE